jgi:two-component system LytT family response regulator
MSMRALLADDEEIARRGLRIRLERATDIEIVGECGNGAEAIKAIQRLAPDLVFLDIQMPELSGIEVVQALPPRLVPHIVFVTAFDQYAVRAFEVHALDYLLKPIDDERLADALRHARATLSNVRDGAYARQVVTAFAALKKSGLIAPPAGSDRIAIPVDGRLTLVRVTDIDWLGALGNYVSVHVGKKSWLLRETISAMEQRLAPHGFVRIHRSTLVNIQRVIELRSLRDGEFTVVLGDGTALKLSRSYRDALDQLVGNRL